MMTTPGTITATDYSLYEKGDKIDIEEQAIVLYVPNDAVSIEVIAKVPDLVNNSLAKVSKTLNFSEIREAREQFENPTYVITDEGRKWLESFEKEDVN